MFWETDVYNDMVDVVKQNINEEIIYQQYSDERTREVVNYGELVATLFQPIDYDIKIDSTILLKSAHSLDKISSYGINPDCSYKKSYQYDSDGNVEMIKYSSVAVGDE